MAETVRIVIDGHGAEVAAGITILEAVRAEGGDLPTLCHSPHLEAHGACRLCLVEVEGRDRPVAACHTRIEAGASYVTASERLTRIRRGVLELIVSDHRMDCEDCAAGGGCDLKRVMAEVGLAKVRYETPVGGRPVADTSHPLLHLDMALCIACARCVRACDEVQGSFVLGMAGRGLASLVIAGNGTGLEEADCRSCGQCVVECPTGAIRDAEKGVNPDLTVQTTCGYCGVGCSLEVGVRDKRVISARPVPEGSANRGHACVKGRYGHGFVHAGDRLKTPLIRDGDGFREASWDEALDLVARRLSEIRDAHGPSGFGMISSSRCTNEENFIAQKFTRVVMNTNSVDNCARVCHSPSAFALGAALGTGAGTNSFEDVEISDVLMVVGANPTEAHPVLGARIKLAALRGAKLIVIDPRNTELARIADIHLALTPGSNVAVINALQSVLIEDNLIDRDFLAAHTEGFDAVREALDGQGTEWAAALSGVPAEALGAAARLYASGQRAQILWGLGITESCHGTMAAFGLINMALMTGNLGRPGTGAGPIRGQNNVQGACDMGALPSVFSDYRPVTDAAARADHAEVWGAIPPTQVGFKTPEMFEAARAGSLKALYVIAQDVAQSDPDTQGVNEALEALDLLVVQDLFINETAKKAHIVLPGSSFLEKDGTFVNSDRRIQRVRQAIPPLTGLTDGDIIVRIARRMGVEMNFGEPLDPSRVMDEIARLTPKWGGVSYQRLERDGFVQWPCPEPGHPGTAIVHEGGAFLRGKGRLTPTPWRPPADAVDEDYPLMLTTGRSLYHYNVGTMTRRTPIAELARAREETLRIHPEDAERYGVKNRSRVRVTSRHGWIDAPAEVTDETRPGIVFMTFHFPETRTNLLINRDADEQTLCPEYKVTAVKVKQG